MQYLGRFFLFMTSQERHQNRYNRRKQKRLNKKQEYVNQYDNDDNITIPNLIQCSHEVRKGVSWKYSVRLFTMNLIINVYQLYQSYLTSTFNFPPLYEFNLNERGKIRHIKSSTVGERVLQKCLCNYILNPILSHYLIYDNGASIKGKGVGFARKRVRKHLVECYRKYGNDFYYLKMDFHHYFEEIDQDILLQQLSNYITSPKIMNMIRYFIHKFGKNGLGLGSQMSQILAIFYVNKLDHYIKDQCSFKWYGRYMDDSYILCESKEKLQNILIEIKNICKELHITINDKKTVIKPMKCGFEFLQCKYSFTNSGKLKQHGGKATCKRERRKLKAMFQKLNKGEITPQEFENTYLSWRESMKKIYDNDNYIMNVDKLYTYYFYQYQKR